MIASLVYILSAITSALCAVLLFRRFLSTNLRMLMWCTIAFAGFTLNNVLLVIDLLIIPDVDLSMMRMVVADASIGILALGLAWESR